MIDGIPFWYLVIGVAGVMLVSFGGLAVAGPVQERPYPTLDLLRLAPVRRVLLWRPFRLLLQASCAALFLFVIVAGLFGRQQAGSNVATVITWTYWWILLVVFSMLLGKAWCYICPWDAVSGWLSRLSAWGPGRWPLTLGRRWPGPLRNLYPAALLFLGLTWLELGYGVTTRPLMTAVLALLMFFLAFVPALVYERSAFCRYGCLVGRISGLYALFAPVEVRARDRQVCASCRTRDCYHGNDRGLPCPTSQYLGGMTKNTYCIMCGECAFTCPSDNVALNLRPPGVDLARRSPVRHDEAAMIVIMLSMTTFHGLTMTPTWHAGVATLERTLGVSYLVAFSLGMAGILAALAAGYLLFVQLSHLAAGRATIGARQLGVRYAYSMLPIALFYHFAHNAMHFGIEGGTLAPLLSDPMGLGWNLLGTATLMPGPLVPLRVIWVLMVAFILFGHVWSLVIAHRVAMQVYPDRRTALRSELPMLLCMIGYSTLSLWIIAQPMDMRTAL